MISVLVTLVVVQATPPPPRDSAILRVGTREVVTFRGALGAATASERATAASNRIAAALAARADSVSTRTMAEGVLVQLGDHPVFVITSTDVDTLSGESVASQAGAVAGRLATAVREVEEAGSLRSILVALALALLATVLLVVAIRLLISGRRKTDARLGRVDAAKWPGLSIRGFTLLRPTQFVAAARVILTVTTWTIGIVAGYLYVTFVLTQFPWTRPWGQALGHYLVSTLARLALGALAAIPGLFTVALIFLATRFLVRLVARLFQAAERGIVVLPGVHPETAEPTRRIVTALMWMFALIVAYPYLPGSGSAAFKGVSVFGGLLLTLGSAGVVGQAMAGLVLMYARGFKVGDYVQIGQTQGTVVALGLLSTRIRTPKNEYVTLPNGVVVGGAITNFSAPQDFAHHLTIYSSVTIGYDVPWRQVHDLMIGGAKATEGVLATPEPFVLQRALNDWYVEYQVNAAIDPKRASELPAFYSRLHGRIQDAFWAAGVEILSPGYFAVRDGNTSTVPPEQRPKRRPGAFRVDVNPSA